MWTPLTAICGARPSFRSHFHDQSEDAFIAPIVLGTGVFYIWPIFGNFYLSFTTSGPFGGTTWTGLANHAHLLSDSDLVGALIYTVVYTVIVMLGVPLALILAALINRPGLRFARGHQTLFFLPYVAMPVAIAQVREAIYNGDYGILNAFLGLFGIHHVYWVSTPGWALVATSVVGLWISLGFNMIVLLAGLKGIPPELYEAASIDGASWRQFVSITVPMVSRTTFFLSVVTAIAGFQLFDLLFVLIGPNNPVMPQTQSLVLLFWHASFQNNDQGYGAAIAVMIMVIIGLITAAQFALQRRWVKDV